MSLMALSICLSYPKWHVKYIKRHTHRPFPVNKKQKMEIEEIRDLDDLIFEEIQTYFLKTTTSNFSKEYPNTNIIIHF